MTVPGWAVLGAFTIGAAHDASLIDEKVPTADAMDAVAAIRRRVRFTSASLSLR